MGYSNKLLFSSKRVLLLLATLSLIALATGCGDSSGSSAVEVTTSSLSKPAFLKRANAICAKEVERVLRGISSSSPDLGRTFASAVQTTVAEIQQLGAPQGEEAEVEEILAGLQQAADEGRQATGSSLTKVEAPYRTPSEAAIAYGLSQCTF